MATLERINQLALHEQAGTSGLADYVREQFSKLGEKASDIKVPNHYRWGFEYYCDSHGLACHPIASGGWFAIGKNYAILADHEEKR